MATLTDKKIDDTYKDLLQVSNSNSGIDSTSRPIEDGEGTQSTLQLSTTKVTINGIDYPTSDGTNGQAIVTDGSGTLSFSTISATVSELDDIGDVTITSADSGDYVRYNGSAWVDVAASQLETDINHDNLTGFVANEHIDWTSTSSAFSTSGTAATGALGVTGNITVSGTVDGRDIATDGTKLDTIETSADVTDEANVTSALDGASLTGVTVATGDKVLVQDVSDLDNLKTVTTQAIADLNPTLTQEQVEDFAGGVVATGGTKTGISVTYQDLTGDMDFIVSDTTVAGDSGSTAITPGDTLTIAGGTEITTAMSGDTLTINSDFTPSSTDTLTNKTFDANGTGNSLSNVDVADLANGTDGELITWDATGAPATVAVGTSGHVLTSNGTGAAPTFQAGGGGGAPTDSQYVTLATDGDLSQERVLTAGEAIDITDGGAGSTVTIDCEDASTTNKGVVELATDAEVATGTSSTLVPTVDQMGWHLIATATASNSATVEFTGLSATYPMYVVILNDVVPATDSTELRMRTSTDGGSTFDNGASDYAWMSRTAEVDTAPSFGTSGDDAADYIQMTGNTDDIGSDTNESYSARVYIHDPGATTYTRVEFKAIFSTTGGLQMTGRGIGARLSAADVDAIQFYMTSGNIESGNFRLYGIL